MGERVKKIKNVLPNDEYFKI